MNQLQPTYTVAVAGLGKRGTHHAEAVSKNPRFKLVGVCDIDQSRAEAAQQKFGVERAHINAGQMLADTQPDVFIFCTLPQLRLPLIQAGCWRNRPAERPLASALELGVLLAAFKVTSSHTIPPELRLDALLSFAGTHGIHFGAGLLRLVSERLDEAE